MEIRLLLAYLVLLAGSAFFTAVESAFAAVNKNGLKAMAEEGSRKARRALHLLDRFDQLHSTMLILVNLFLIGGASCATLFVYHVTGGNATGHHIVAIAATCATLLVFFFVDLLSKSLATTHANAFATAWAPVIRVLMVVLYPLAILFRGIHLLFGKLLKEKEEPTVTEEELSSIIDTVEEEGVIDEAQSDLLQSALEFAETTVADVLTLRGDMVGISVSASHREVMAILREYKYSRFPVYDGDLDHIVGILQARKYLRSHLNREGVSLLDLCTPVYYTTLDAEIDHLLEDMSRKKVTMAIVRDDENCTVGVVTVEDFLEELVGEIFDERDVVNNRFMKLGGDYFRVSASCTMGEMFRDMSYRGKVNVARVKTVGAWVREQLGHAPEEEDVFVWRDLTVTVTEAEEGRVQFVEVKLANPILDAVTSRVEEEEVV